jgi:two-component system, OmpR family, response regulator QseB
MRLLLVEDDPMIGENVRDALKAEGHAVDWVSDGEAAELSLRAGVYDLILLDLGLPKRDGLEVLKRYRASQGAQADQGTAPVLVITARDSTRDLVTGLDAGADDYLAKPFDLPELAARVRALLRRRHGQVQARLSYGGIELDDASHTVLLEGAPLHLSAREFAVLHALMLNPGKVLSRTVLEDKLYGWGEEVGSNTIEVFMHGLRKKIGAARIATVRGVGYRLTDSA